MEIRAIQKYQMMSPQKLRRVASVIKGLKPKDAYEKLPFLGKKAAEPLRKVIGTALANAKQQGLSESDLKIKEIQINQGPSLKRWRAGARGRVKPYRKRMSHIRVILESIEPEPIKEKRVDKKKSASNNGKKKSAKGNEKEKTASADKDKKKKKPRESKKKGGKKKSA